jgi:hypothetical protein
MRLASHRGSPRTPSKRQKAPDLSMPIVVLVLVLVAYGYVMLAYPEYRTWGLALGGAVAAGLGAYFWLTDPETQRTAIRIAPEELTLDNLTLERTVRGAVLEGRVRNGSEDFRLREMTIDLRLHDCPDEEADLAECPVIGGATAIARPDVPPGEIRGFRANYLLANLPPATGVLRYEWVVTETRATE